MTLKTIILFAILFFVIRFLIRFIVPVVRMTRQAQQGMNDIKAQMDAMQQQHAQSAGFNNTAKQTAAPQSKIDGEYIEFEEVK